jgi:hypothetical protein
MDSSSIYEATLATEKEALNFLGALWYEWGIALVQRISKEYNLSEEQNEALMEVLLKSNDWCVEVSE